MIFRRSLLRELTLTGLAVFIVLLSIVVVTQLVKILGQSAAGFLAQEAVLAMIGFSAIRYFPVLIGLTVFISVLMVMGRQSKDHEYIIWQAAGVRFSQFLLPLFIFAFPLMLISASLTLGIAPWAAQQSRTYSEYLQQKEDVAALSPGVFKESHQGQRVYWIQAYSALTQEGLGIFARIEASQNQPLSIVHAKKGHIEMTKEGFRYLVLNEGARYEWRAEYHQWRKTEFAKQWVEIEPHRFLASDVGLVGMPSARLRQMVDPTAQAEWAWRVGLPFSTLVLALIGFALGRFNPRQGQSGRLVLAVFIFMIYYNLLSLIQANIAKGLIPGWIGMWPLHGVMACAALWFILGTSFFSFSKK